MALSGPRVERARLRRGDWLVAPHLHAPSEVIDARVRLAEDGRLRHGGAVHVHHGAASYPARLRVWDEGEGFVRLQLARAAAVLHGDRLVLRDDATGRVMAGGHVVDPFPPVRRRSRAVRVGELSVLAVADPQRALAAVMEHHGWVDVAGFALARNFDAGKLAAGLTLVGRRIAVSEATRAAVRGRVCAALGRYHSEHGDELGPARAVLLSAAGTEAVIAEAMLSELLAEGVVVAQGLVLRLADHAPQLAVADLAAWPRVMALLEAGGLRSVRVREVAEALGVEPGAAEALLVRFERFGRVVRVAANRFFLPATVAALAQAAVVLGEADGFSAADFNRHTGIGRNVAIEVLEFLDGIGVTRRTGELRHVVRDMAEVLV